MEGAKNLVEEYKDKSEFEKEFYLDELQEMANTKQELQTEIDELGDTIDNLLVQNEELEEELQNARRSFTTFQLAVSLLVFAYGMFYGAYFGKCV